MKLLFYDLETTGIKYWRNGIHQISGEIVIDGEVKERLTLGFVLILSRQSMRKP